MTNSLLLPDQLSELQRIASPLVRHAQPQAPAPQFQPQQYQPQVHSSQQPQSLQDLASPLLRPAPQPQYPQAPMQPATQYADPNRGYPQAPAQSQPPAVSYQTPTPTEQMPVQPATQPPVGQQQLTAEQLEQAHLAMVQHALFNFDAPVPVQETQKPSQAAEVQPKKQEVIPPTWIKDTPEELYTKLIESPLEILKDHAQYVMNLTIVNISEQLQPLIKEVAELRKMRDELDNAKAEADASTISTRATDFLKKQGYPIVDLIKDKVIDDLTPNSFDRYQQYKRVYADHEKKGQLELLKKAGLTTDTGSMLDDIGYITVMAVIRYQQLYHSVYQQRPSTNNPNYSVNPAMPANSTTQNNAANLTKEQLMAMSFQQQDAWYDSLAK